jgi:hypothetical protein
MLGRKYGPWAVARLARSVRAWLANPANARVRETLVGELRDWGGRATGRAADTALRLAAEIERRRARSVSAWERELMSLRTDLSGRPRGPEREAALVAYAEEAESAAVLVAEAPDPAGALGEVRDTFRAERAMLREDPVDEDTRGRALRALERALAVCERAARPPEPGPGAGE